MKGKDKLNEIPVAKLNDKELEEIKNLEKKLGEKYYIIAFDNKK